MTLPSSRVLSHSNCLSLTPPLSYTQRTTLQLWPCMTVNVVTNVKEELQAAVSVCVRDVMVLPASVGTSASVLKDAANALNAVSSVAIMLVYVHV